MPQCALHLGLSHGSLSHVPETQSHRASVITSLNLKGGVGKTHLCWLLASVCQERGHRCLIVDLDQQANITQSFLPDHSEPTGVERLFDPMANVQPRDLIRQTAYEHIDIIPVTGHFARQDLSQREQWEKHRLHTALADALAELLSDYDYILLDCPPRMSLPSYAALCASDFVVIPLEAADWGARGTATVRALLQSVRKFHNPRLKLLGYVVSKFKRTRTFQLTYLAQIRQHLRRRSLPDRHPRPLPSSSGPSMKAFPLRSIPPLPMPQTSPANSSTSSPPELRKNTRESAAFRALSALNREPQLALGESESHTPARQEGRVPLRNTYRIELSLIEPDPDQPRHFFDEEALKELAASIQARGIRSPLTVRWEPRRPEIPASSTASGATVPPPSPGFTEFPVFLEKPIPATC